MSIVQLARPEIQALVAYEPAAQADDTIRLNANESPYTYSAAQFRRPLNRYPEVRPRALRDALANHLQCRPEQLLVTRGSSEAIDLVIRAFCRAGEDNIVVPSPSFSMYAHYARVQGANVNEVDAPAAQEFRIDIDAVIAACNDATRVVFICSPNNPTGASVSRADLQKLLDARQDHSVVVVDEAYIEFSREVSALDLLDTNPNLLVLRTLSKALGFAGARCGSVAGDPDVLQMLAAIQSPYALSTPVIECVEDLLRSNALALAEKAVPELVSERERLCTTLDSLNIVRKVYPSDANFFLVRVHDVNYVLKECEARNILLRRLHGALADCIRISVGSPNENDQLLQAMLTLEKS